MREKQRETNRRGQLLKFRATKGERLAIEQRAAERNATLSEYVRAAALGRRAKPSGQATGERLHLIEALAQLGKIGSNLNQLAKHCNQGHDPERAAIVATLAELEQVQTRILDELER